MWRSKIELANYPPPLNQPPMVLPKINHRLGGHIPEKGPSIHDQMNAAYAKYSAAYWAGVKKRYPTAVNPYALCTTESTPHPQ